MFRKILAPLTGVCLGALCLFASPAQAAEPENPDSAMEAFKSTHEAVIALVDAGAGDSVYKEIVDRRLDYKWLAKASLGGASRYEKRCAPRCEEYEALLTELIRENYLRMVKQAQTGKVEYVGEDVRKKATKVDTVVTVEKNGRKQKIKVSYVMYYSNGHWWARNIITDGVSLAKTYRFEFNKILREEGIDGLIDRLQKKLAEVAKAQTDAAAQGK